MGKYDIAKMGGVYTIDPQAAYEQSSGYSVGKKYGNGSGVSAATAAERKFIKAAKYESKIPNNGIRVMTPRKSMEIGKAIKVGIKAPPHAKGTLRIRRSTHRI